MPFHGYRCRVTNVLLWGWVAACLIAAPFLLDTAHAAEAGDLYIGVYALGSWPVDREAILRGAVASGSQLENAIGAGIKVAIFPHATKRMVGVELESYVHGTELTFSFASGHGTSTIGVTDLIVMNSMVNVLLRYPGTAIQPYAGIGIGLSHAYVTGADIPGRADRDFESSTAFGRQALAGVQVALSEGFFAFGEYKYFAANYHWAGLSLDFRSHYAVGGVGIRF